MIRLLIIAYWYPPLNVMGSVRAMKFVKYLPEMGIEPVVFSTSLKPFYGTDVIDPEMDPGDIEVYRGKSFDTAQSIRSLIKRLGLGGNVGASPSDYTKSSLPLRLYNNLLSLPDPQLGWYILSRRKALSVCREKKIDVILSTAPPFSGHLLGAYLKKKLNIPWIADYRDLWSNNDYHYFKTGIFSRIDTHLENKSINFANAIITASQPLAERIEKFHDQNVRAINNGFDRDDYTFDTIPESKFSITYTGLFYPGRQDTYMLFEAISQLIREKKISEENIQVLFFGRKLEYMEELKLKYSLNNVVRVLGQISSEEAKKRQKAATLLLLLDEMVKDNTSLVIAAKVYEYLGARRPILCLGAYEGAISDILKRTNSGYFLTSVEDTKKTILALYKRFYRDGFIPYEGNESVIEQYSYKGISRSLSEIVMEIVKKTKKESR